MLAATACSDSGALGVEDFDPPSLQSSIVTASVKPEAVVLQPGETAEFSVAFSNEKGKGIKGPVLWSATGGSINRNATVGTYVAGQTPGDYHVIAKAPATGVADTALVKIEGNEEKGTGDDSGSSGDAGTDGESDADGGSDADGDGSEDSPTVATVEVSPEKATLTVGESVRFEARLEDSKGNPVQGKVTWRASGGTITADGVYTAGTSDGTYSVKASHEETQASDEATVEIQAAESGSEKLNFYSGFEAGDLSEWNNSDYCCSHSATVVSSPVREGRRAGRLELRRSDPNARSELRNVPWKSNYGFAGRVNGPEMWYGISVYVPDWYKPTRGDYQIIWQVHAPPGTGQQWHNPHFAVWLNALGLSVTNRWGVDGNQSQDQFNIGAVQTNRWYDFVVRAVWRNDSQGILQVWLDGRLVVDKRGPTTYGDRLRDYYNTADIYRAGSSWPADADVRVLYFDAVRVYEGTNGYNAVAPR